MKRREFISKSCGICSTLSSVGLISSIISSCGTIPTIKINNKTKEILINKSEFLKTNKLILRTLWLPQDILVYKKNEDEYHALLLLCTHEDAGLSVSDKSIHCNSHGSIFSLEGQILKEPALKPLKSFPVKKSTTTITINII